MKKKPVIIGLSALCLLGLSTYPVIKNAELARQKEEQAAVRRKVADEAERLRKADADLIAPIHEEVKDYFYYQQLSEQEQKNYLRLVNGLRSFSDKTSLKSEDGVYSWNRVYMAVAYDFPEFYWLSESRYTVDFDQHIYPENAKETYDTLQAIGDEIIAQMPDGSDYDKVKYIYEYIIHNTQYNTAALEDDELGWQNQSIRTVFIDKSSICNGYASAFNFLCRKAGIESIYVAGDISASENSHAWNLVKIDGQYYTVDTTWGDPVFNAEVAGQEGADGIDYSYLCMPPQIFNQSHFAYESFFAYAPSYKEFDTVYQYPELATTNLNYHALQGSYFETYTPEQIASYLASNLANQKTVTVQIGFLAEYERFVAELNANSNTYLHDYFRHFPGYKGYAYLWDPSAQTISFELQ